MSLAGMEALEAVRSNRPDKVARALGAAGCRGTPGGLDCPLAEFISQRIGESVNLTPEGLLCGPDYEAFWPIPPWATKFMARFDAGLYPYLER